VSKHITWKRSEAGAEAGASRVRIVGEEEAGAEDSALEKVGSRGREEGRYLDQWGCGPAQIRSGGGG